MPFRLVCVSDTHTMGRLTCIPAGDMIIHCGDLTFQGTQNEVFAELEWLDSLPHQYKAFCCGNHDWFFDIHAPPTFRNWSLGRTSTPDEILALFPGITYLQDSSVTIEGVKFYGSPWQPPFHNWAFNMSGVGPDDFGNPTVVYHESDKNPDPAKTWAKIPDDTQVLITHAPPRGYCDEAYKLGDGRLGCPALRAKVDTLKYLKLHVFGHIHEAYGKTIATSNGATYANVCVCNRDYETVNPPMVFDI